MSPVYRKRRKSRRPPLDEDLILCWADEHFQQYGVWPTQRSGPVTGQDGEHWASINRALRNGHRGLLLGSSLAILLLECRGVSNRLGRSNITVEAVLLWADHHFTIYGRYPNLNDGIIDLAPTENWRAVNSAICGGYRGLPGGSTLARLLQAHRGKRNMACLPKISLEVILAWADEHQLRTGEWPIAERGDVQAAPGERWPAIDQALKHGQRGLPGGASLAALLIQHRGKSDIRNSSISIETITDWLRSHAARHGKYPTCDTGIVENAPEESWGALDKALISGYRGLPGGSSVAKLKEGLIQEGKLPRLYKTTRYDTDNITKWLNNFAARHGKYPSIRSGLIEDAPGETWKKVNNALINGYQGLQGGSSLAKLKQKLIREGKLRDLTTQDYVEGI